MDSRQSRFYRRSSWFLALCLSGALAGLVGCSAPNGPDVASDAAPDEAGDTGGPGREVIELDCADSIEAIGGLDDFPEYSPVLDAVALPVALDHGDALQSLAQDVDTPFEHFAKFGLVTRGDAESTIEVSDPDNARMVWGAKDDAGLTALRISACGDETWYVFAGGVRTTEPMCTHLTVSSNDQTETVSLPLGQACTGSESGSTSP